MTRGETLFLTRFKKKQLKALLTNIIGDSNHPDKPKAVNTPDNIVIVTKDRGDEFSADRITEPSEEELEGVAGGTHMAGIQS